MAMVRAQTVQSNMLCPIGAHLGPSSPLALPVCSRRVSSVACLPLTRPAALVHRAAPSRLPMQKVSCWAGNSAGPLLAVARPSLLVSALSSMIFLGWVAT